MRSLSVVGGIYRERCLQPTWDAVLGSAGRAAQALGTVKASRKRLHAYMSDRARSEVELLAELADFELVPTDLPFLVLFDYAHTLGDPVISPPIGLMGQRPPLAVKDDVVLRYGMLEGDAVVAANIAVYDPQSAFGAAAFTANGSSAKRLAVVLNRLELRSITGEEDPRAGADWLFRNDGAEVVVLKMGALGARVITPDGAWEIPLYRSERVWKLGSGDVFSATFAAMWALEDMAPDDAADIASRATAWYCGHRALPTPDAATLATMPFEQVRPGTGRIYLAAPFFDLGQRWLVEESRRALLQAGAQVFSPIHEVGPGAAEVVAPADLAGIEDCDVLLAIVNGMDPGTVFEAGYAIRKGIPVVALAENSREEDLKMFVGSGATVTSDFATAIYQAVWRLPR
ncbi:PfkB family carbohydrate kinase [Mesorhizobium sp. NZP2298]|uniref:PfkB family carbohydrate kinase n=1 Tax=Mesorhizobium sp. NZP2298 TaxID=2483403 RepID=UPI00155234D1|nr:PfkB family carbohydrate kinase [Mesorhizobium sp. NZP2298]QKC98702.1 nucleoside 2-deoxyribosyltransferase [Mesorhizobium sp. NZP2298]